ncbi:hypothetical protein JTE90_004587 [Oedothorax gibbosus]|uniref:RNA polymerase I-specific transcription initiation factor RRN3 n=1 Tax=Oedothorax gibbosus TaxID=931172 RepID=A0AAV6UJ56_9ARAC|nr:hypothetical protein JTE90_004587 [Oedothorax gibbosus]
MVLIPILKDPMSSLMKNVNSPSSTHVKFELPDEKQSIITYYNEDGKESQAFKLNYIIKTIHSKDTEDALLLKWITEFKDTILFLDRQNEPITNALLKLEWYTKDSKLVRMYQELLWNLVTAHPYYLRNVLMMTIVIFSKVSSENETMSEEDKLKLQNVHGLLLKITELVPSSQQTFVNMLSEKFPYMKSSPCVILHYVENMLIVGSYLPSKRYLILECIIKRLIQMDVLCSKNAIEEAEYEKQEENQMELDGIESKAGNTSDQMALPLAHTLDLLMNCLFTFIKETSFPQGKDQMNWEATKKLYKEILTAFDKIILPTQGCCHAQYILFYICSLKQELCDGFLDYLWKKVQNPNVAPVFRQISAFFIGSFLSRAKYICISTVTACLNLMCNWIHRYIDAHTSQDLNSHGSFHSVCQTVFYVFAFRNRELLEMKDGYKYLRSLNFDRIVTCRLNPLRYCDRSIVQNFASISRNHQIAYVYPVIEKNNRNLLYANNHSSSEECAAGAMIPTFFPFDPYLLKKSKHWVEPNYRLYNHDNKEEESLELMDEEEPNVNDVIFSYSMSPGFKKSYLLNR